MQKNNNETGEGRKLLLINGYGSATSIIMDLLGNRSSDSNIYLAYPLGVLTLAGWCRDELPGLEIQILDATMHLHRQISNSHRAPLTLSEHIRQLLSEAGFKPDFIGISMSFSNGHRACLEIARLCKVFWPGATVIAGGMHATTFTRRIISDPAVDIVVRGAGDESFIALLRNLSSGRDIRSIPGVVTDSSNLESVAPPLSDLNRIPRLPYEFIDMEYLMANESTAPIDKAAHRTAMVFMSRGCSFGCTFCSADKIHGKRVRFIDLKRIVDDIELLFTVYRTDTLCIIDDLFGADKAYFTSFFNEIDRRGLKFRLVIPGGLSLAVFNEEMVDVLVAHGLDAVYFPLESGSKFVQEHVIKKRINLEKAIRLITYAKEKKLFTGINIVLGTPGETKEMMKETYDFIKKLPVDWIAFFQAFPYPETEMTRILVERGILTDDKLIEIWDSASQGFRQRPFDTEEITGKELSELVSDFNIDLNFFHNYNIRTGNFGEMISKLDKIIGRYPYHTVALSCRARCLFETGDKEAAQRDVAEIRRLIGTNNDSKKMADKYEMQMAEILSVTTTKAFL